MKKASHKKRDKSERSRKKKKKSKSQEASSSLVEIGAEEEEEAKPDEGSELGCSLMNIRTGRTQVQLMTFAKVQPLYIILSHYT